MAFTPATSPYWNAPSAGSNPSPAYSGVFIPEIWSSKLLEKFYDATVLAAIANTDYEGEISSYGDTVHIRQRPDITINDYQPDLVLAVERPSAALVDLTIDQAKYFNVICDDIYKVQSDIDLMNEWSADASEQMKISIDTDVLAAIDAGVAAANKGAAAGAISGSIALGTSGSPLAVTPRSPGAGEVEVLDVLLRMGQVLDEQNVPEQGRWVVIPAWMAAQIKKSELRDSSLAGDGVSILRNGRLGMVDRFTIYMSNLLPNTGTPGEDYIFAGHRVGLSFASQLTNMETLRSEFTFGTLMRGLQVYGFDVVKDSAIASAVVTAA